MRGRSPWLGTSKARPWLIDKLINTCLHHFSRDRRHSLAFLMSQATSGCSYLIKMIGTLRKFRAAEERRSHRCKAWWMPQGFGFRSSTEFEADCSKGVRTAGNSDEHASDQSRHRHTTKKTAARNVRAGTCRDHPKLVFRQYLWLGIQEIIVTFRIKF